MDSLQLKRTTLSLIASRIPEDQIQTLRVAFSKMDKNGDGSLTFEELKQGMQEINEINLSEAELLDAMNVIDSNQNGLIDYTEFIAACLQSYNYLQESHLRSAFAYFDQDNSGTISADELRMCLQSDDFTLSEEQIQQLLEGVDTDGDGQIDYHEFINMMKSTIGLEIRPDPLVDGQAQWALWCMLWFDWYMTHQDEWLKNWVEENGMQ